jgi:hypothetical protein
MSRVSMLTPGQQWRLTNACRPVCRAFGEPPYLVGSALARVDYRDVDVRTILSDERYAELFPDAGDDPWHDPLWTLICHTIGLQLSAAANLNVDYQIQTYMQAGEHKGPRIPLGLEEPHA